MLGRRFRFGEVTVISAEITPFPATRNRKIVGAVADRVAARPERADEVLIAYLDAMWDLGQHRGIDPTENERDVSAFADAVQELLSTDQAVVLERAVASVTGRGRRFNPPPPVPPARPLINFKFPRKVALFTPIKPPEYIGRIARIALDYDPQEGERFVVREMRVVGENLVALGADPVAVACEVRKLESAIRLEMWNVVMGMKR